MKQFTISLLFLILFSLSANSHASPCSKDLGSLPIQSNGRVKPLQVHAKESIKFIYGKSSVNGKSATTIYCSLSFWSLKKMDNSELPLKIRIDHEKTKEFLGIQTDVKHISYDFAIGKFSDMRSYHQLLKSRGDKSSFEDDLNKVILRTKLYDDIIHGLNWQIPIVLGSKKHSAHTGIAGMQQKSDGLQWASLHDILKIIPDIKTPEHFIATATKAAEKYTAISDTYLMELKYDQLHLFHWAILATLLSLVAVTVYKQPRHKIVIGSIFIIFALEITAVTMRTMISGRAPVTNMYETVMWVGLGSLLFATILAMFRKEKLFLLGGLTLNTACLFMMTFANNMLSPSIQPLVPVLRDNFWLSTHVTMITISYAALALSWMMANYYLIRATLKPVDSKQTAYLTSLCYDCIKIGVVLLAGGIILGGVWADYSWGRFWGWDPKETWSLIALLLYIAILHGRFAGWINNQRFIPCVALAFLSIMMAWFGVNYILATGLHSYGFSNGGLAFLLTIFITQFAILILYYLRKKTLPN
jgi:cytochrome c-type biogenesis protein CcsB